MDFQCEQNAPKPSTYQKESNGASQDEARNDIRTMVSILRNSVESGEECGAKSSQAQHWLGQPTALGLDCASDVHLKESPERRALKTPFSPLTHQGISVQLRSLFSVLHRAGLASVAPGASATFVDTASQVI